MSFHDSLLLYRAPTRALSRIAGPTPIFDVEMRKEEAGKFSGRDWCHCQTKEMRRQPCESGYRTDSRNRPDAGAVQAAISTRELGCPSIDRRKSSSLRSPVPILTRQPTILRTILQRKCDASIRN